MQQSPACKKRSASILTMCAPELLADILISRRDLEGARRVLERLYENHAAIAHSRLVQVLLAQAEVATTVDARLISTWPSAKSRRTSRRSRAFARYGRSEVTGARAAGDPRRRARRLSLRRSRTSEAEVTRERQRKLASEQLGVVHDALRDPALDELRQRYREGELVLFAGAGVSAAAGLPSWGKLVGALLDRAKARGATADAVGEVEQLPRPATGTLRVLADAVSAAEGRGRRS